jgi:polysaccharide export outer membrane protein
MKKKLGALICVGIMSMASLAFASDYKICPGDEISVVFQNYQELNEGNGATAKIYKVRPDGRVNFPLIGSIDAKGLTMEELTALLKKDYRTYLKDPNPLVNLEKLGTTRVYVFGEVKRPGVYELTKSHNVLDAIAASSGYTEYAAKKVVFLIRADELKRKTKPIVVNLNNLLKKGDLTQNYVLHEGDALFLSSNGKITLADIRSIASIAYYANDISSDD